MIIILEELVILFQYYFCEKIRQIEAVQLNSIISFLCLFLFSFKKLNEMFEQT